MCRRIERKTHRQLLETRMRADVNVRPRPLVHKDNRQRETTEKEEEKEKEIRRAQMCNVTDLTCRDFLGFISFHFVNCVSDVVCLVFSVWMSSVLPCHVSSRCFRYPRL